MAIGVEGQYIFRFSITKGAKKLDDFIQEVDLQTFTLIEEAGNVLPTFELRFDTQSPEVLHYLNEGNEFTISFGKISKGNHQDLVDSKFSILRFNYNRTGESHYSVYVNGVYANLKYLSEDAIELYTSSSGVAVIKQIAEKYQFKTKFNIEVSKDIQTWIRPNISAKKFVNELWMHSWLPNSFIGIGIDSRGTFILKDMKLESDTFLDTPHFRFSTEITDQDKSIMYDGDYVLDSNTGFLNYWMGYGREKHIFDLEDGVDVDVLETSDIFLTNASTLVRTSNIPKKSSEAGFSNDNVHSKYWQAYHKNLQNLALFSSHKVMLSFHGNYKPIKILDIVTFSDIELSAKTKEKAALSAGRYFVSKVSRNISNRNFVTTVQLCRESLTGVEGTLR